MTDVEAVPRVRPDTRQKTGSAAIQLERVSKHFPGVQALSSVDLEIRAGEIHGLLGQNGAGKSTLVKILSGAQSPSHGRVRLYGEPVRFRNPVDAQLAGIHTIYQELSLFAQLTVAENVYVSDLPTSRGFVRWGHVKQNARKALARVGCNVDVERRVDTLSVAEQQFVEIAKAIHHDASVVLLDEPTATLPAPDVRKLFDLLVQLRSQGITLVYISHRLDEVQEICDSVSVLRDGRHVGTHPTTELDADGMVRLMVGERLYRTTVGGSAEGDWRLNTHPQVSTNSRQPALEVEAVDDGQLLRGVTFSVRQGEAVAVTGLVGSGHSELAGALFGSRTLLEGQIRVDGRSRRLESPRAAIKAGLGWVPEERKSQGLVPGMPVSANITLAKLDRVSTLGIIRNPSERSLAQKMVSLLGIKVAHLSQPVDTLSGGNQQKVVLSKWMCADSRILLVSEPTRGVDVSAKLEIYRELQRFLEAGNSVLIFTSEIDEALMCDRFYVIANGTIAGEFEHGQVSPDQLATLLR